MAEFPLWAAIRTVKERIGTWVGFARIQAIAPEVTKAEWAQAIGQAQAALANRMIEATRPLNRRPTASEIVAYTSRRATGFLQQLEIFVRDRDTGLIESRPYTIRTQVLRSRGSVVAEGLRRYQDAVDNNPDDYPEDILGAAYAGTLELIPL